MKLGRLANAIKKTLHFHAPALPDRCYGSTPNYLIIVSNCSKILTTPAKSHNKKYYFHSGRPGGLKTLSWRELQLANPEKMIELALRRMLPRATRSKGPLKKVRFHRNEYTERKSLRPIEIR